MTNSVCRLIRSDLPLHWPIAVALAAALALQQLNSMALSCKKVVA